MSECTALDWALSGKFPILAFDFGIPGRAAMPSPAQPSPAQHCTGHVPRALPGPAFPCLPL